MIIITDDLFKCEICGKIYDKLKYAVKCENLHLSPFKIKATAEAMEKTKHKMKQEGYDSESLEVADIALFALNKMIPRKPHYFVDTGYVCPSCGKKIDKWESVIIRCSRCGQAIGNED